MLIFRATVTFTDAEEHPAPGGPGGPGDFEVPGRDFRGLVGARPPRAPRTPIRIEHRDGGQTCAQQCDPLRCQWGPLSPTQDSDRGR